MDYNTREYCFSDPVSHFPEVYSGQIDNLLQALGNNQLSQAFITARDGNILGLGGFYQNKLHYHPNDFRLVLATAKHDDESRVRECLYETISTRLREKALMVRCRVLVAANIDDISFWENKGYQFYYSVFEPTISIPSIEVELYQHILDAVLLSGYTIKPLSEYNQALIQDELLQLCIDSYDKLHITNPPALGEDWQSIFLESEVDPDAFFIIEKASRIVGFSSMQIDSEGLLGACMWDGVSRSEAALAYPLRVALKLHEIRFAQRHRLKTLSWEVDSVDIVGVRLMNALPFDVLEPYKSYVKELYRAEHGK